MSYNIKDKVKVKNEIPLLYPYHADDISTHRYSGCTIVENNGALKVSKWINNPFFKYLHLCKDK